MATATETPPPKVWTTEDLLALPDDGVERWIINGQLREKPSELPGATMTVRNRHHSKIMARVTGAILAWNDTRPNPRGEVYCGEAGVRLPGRDHTVGVDVVYVTPDVVAVQDDDTTTMIDGVPTLVVEILSPNDTLVQVEEKIDAYRDAGVPLIWIVSVHHRTVTLHRPGQEPELFNVTHTMPESSHMPGFAPPVATLFG